MIFFCSWSAGREHFLLIFALLPASSLPRCLRGAQWLLTGGLDCGEYFVVVCRTEMETVLQLHLWGESWGPWNLQRKWLCLQVRSVTVFFTPGRGHWIWVVLPAHPVMGWHFVFPITDLGLALGPRLRLISDPLGPCGQPIGCLCHKPYESSLSVQPCHSICWFHGPGTNVSSHMHLGTAWLRTERPRKATLSALPGRMNNCEPPGPMSKAEERQFNCKNLG